MTFTLSLVIKPWGEYCGDCQYCTDDDCNIFRKTREYNYNAHGEDEFDYYRVDECLKAEKENKCTAHNTTDTPAIVRFLMT